jgi:nucleoside-diphosphate-sugar epimerase
VRDPRTKAQEAVASLWTGDHRRPLVFVRLLSQGRLQAFANPTVAEKLNLNNDQKSKIREIVEATRSSFAGAFNKGASEQVRTDARNKRAETQKENMTKVQALLTDDQKKAWRELTGEPIEIQYPARRSNN